MPKQQNLMRLTHLARNVNATWLFRIDLDSIHASFIENFMYELAKSGIFAGGWFVGNWWFDDEGMAFLSHLFSNWEEMKEKAVATEGTVEAARLLLAAENKEKYQ